MKSISVQLGAAENQSPVRDARDWNVPFNSPTVVTGLVVFVGYYLGAKLGFALTFRPHPVSVLWPPNSILAAALLLTPVRIWWLVLLAAFPAHLAAELQSQVPPTMVLCWFISNSCEAVIGAGLTRYLIGGPVKLNCLRSVGFFCLGVVFIAPFLSSFLDAGFVRWNVWGQGAYWEIWRVRFTSNVLAALTVAPLIVTWATSGIPSLRNAPRSRYLEVGLLLLGLLSVSFAVLYRLGSGTDSALLYLLLPFLLWAAVQFGSCGASTALGIVTFSAIWGATHGHGPFAGGSAEQNALAVQVFLIVLAVPLMFLAAVIDERAKGETELRESDERFRLVADSAPVLIWMSGLDKLCIFFNKPWLEFTGRTIEQELGNGWAEGVHPDDFQSCLKTYVEAFDAREPFVMQYRLRRHDGEYRLISDTGVPRYDIQKNFAGYIGSCMDVTELINKEEALRESEERMSLAADAAGLIVWTWDIRRDEVSLSDRDRAFFGFSQGEKLNADRVRSVVHSEDRQFVRQVVENSLRTRKEIEGEYRIVLPDGKVRWVTRRGRVEFDGNGEPTWERGVLMDITERKQAEEKFRLATEASPSGIVLMNDRGRIVLVNSQIEKLFGYRREELVGKLVDILVPERFASQHPAHRAEFLAGPTARSMGAGRELFAKRKDGSEFAVEIGLNPIQTPEGMLVLAAVVDISARKLAQAEALQRRQEVGHLSRVAVMGELAASIAHELNQPLSGIIGNASAGQRFIDRGNVDLGELRDLLADIVADGRRAGDVIRGVQSMVKKGAPARQRVNLNDLVMNVVHMVNADAVLHSCQMETLLEPNLPPIEADPIQLQQVLINLVINAFDAMRNTPLSRRKVVITTERNGDGAICTSVRDYGVGISEEAGERLFDHFFTTKAEGLGMGLGIVRSIVESHDGTVAAENVEGGGARFHFTLPVSPAAAAALLL
jgi:PAS domain S-box-containing protein